MSKGWALEWPSDPPPIDVACTQVDQVYHAEKCQSLWSAMVGLKSREFWVLVLRYGMDGGGERTLQFIADTLGVSKEAVRLLQLRAQKKLKKWIQKGDSQCSGI